MSDTVVCANDDSSHLAVKDAVLARSGIYIYSRDEVLAWGVKPRVDKPFYREYRPAGVVIAAKDMFNMVPVTKQHTPVDITPDNFHSYASGVTGGPIEAAPLENGEIGLKGKIAFFTRDAYDFYGKGNRETSPGFKKVVREVSNANEMGYDFVVEKIESVNHLAIVPSGRGGASVRVMDSAMANSRGVGGIGMNILERLGIVKAKDENFKLSDVVIGSVAKIKSLDAAALEKEIASTLDHLKSFGDSDAKKLLVALVTDCYKNPYEVVAAKDKVAVELDKLYVACKDADAAVVQKILDAAGAEKKESEPKPADAKDAAPPNYDAIIEAAVQKAVVAANDGFEAKIDASVRKALGLVDDKDKSKKIETLVNDSAPAEDASWLMGGMFVD